MPQINYPPLDEPVNDTFPLAPKPYDPNTFEIAVVLGGTVAAAAYTAGVVDFLIQALDAWNSAKEAGKSYAPKHKVIIKIVTGTSGGALTAVLLARSLRYAFPPCEAALTDRSRNPFYDTWVNQIDIKDLLDTTDLYTDRNKTKLVESITSLLCADKITQIGGELAIYRGDPLARPRDWIEQQLPLVVTTTNLKGIPYSSDFRGSNRQEYFIDHADHIRLRIDIGGANPPQARPYETVISDTPTNGALPWTTAINAGRASGAFPVGLPSISHTRPLKQYRYRYTVANTGPNAGAPVWLNPKWQYLTSSGSQDDSLYQMLCVDGGCFNNEPIRIADDWLNGISAARDTKPETSHRAVLLVDPFADAPDTDPIQTDMFSTAGAALQALIGGARFETAELDLFTDENIYSRYLINPVSERSGVVYTGGAAIATNPLGAFGGFLEKAYRNHDFFLGRRNCQQMLRKSFVLGADNSLFDSWGDTKNATAATLGGFLPIIPLMPEVCREIGPPDWPFGLFEPDKIRKLLKQRLDIMAQIAANGLDIATAGPLSWLRNRVLSGIDDKAVDFFIGKVRDGLVSGGLVAEPPPKEA